MVSTKMYPEPLRLSIFIPDTLERFAMKRSRISAPSTGFPCENAIELDTLILRIKLICLNGEDT